MMDYEELEAKNRSKAKIQEMIVNENVMNIRKSTKNLHWRDKLKVITEIWKRTVNEWGEELEIKQTKMEK